MKFVIQRVKNASVEVEEKVIGKINHGLLVFVGVSNDDTVQIADKMIKKLIGLRIFEDEDGKANVDIKTVSGEMLIISQFTLYADTKDGNRPAFVKAMNPVEASKLYDLFNEELRTYDIEVLTGQFGADMKINLLNDGPVTIIYDENL